MHTILSFTLVPVSSGLSLSPFIAACSDIVSNSGLEYEFHANGTNIEGPWDEVLKIVQDCQVKVHAMGTERIFTTIQLSTRTDRVQKMNEKLISVAEKRATRHIN